MGPVHPLTIKLQGAVSELKVGHSQGAVGANTESFAGRGGPFSRAPFLERSHYKASTLHLRIILCGLHVPHGFSSTA